MDLVVLILILIIGISIYFSLFKKSSTSPRRKKTVSRFDNRRKKYQVMIQLIEADQFNLKGKSIKFNY